MSSTIDLRIQEVMSFLNYLPINVFLTPCEIAVLVGSNETSIRTRIHRYRDRGFIESSKNRPMKFRITIDSLSTVASTVATDSIVRVKGKNTITPYIRSNEELLLNLVLGYKK